MRAEPNPRVETHRIRNPPGFPAVPAGSNTGIFLVKGPLSSHGRAMLKIISSGANPPEHLTEGTLPETLKWEHVSVSCQGRCPTWDEMHFVKELFWMDEETVIQFHPKKSEYVNCNPHVLHLWKKKGVDYELPPQEAV